MRNLGLEANIVCGKLVSVNPASFSRRSMKGCDLCGRGSHVSRGPSGGRGDGGKLSVDQALKSPRLPSLIAGEPSSLLSSGFLFQSVFSSLPIVN